MNRIFRTLWNPSRGAWVAAPEISRGHARSASTGGGPRTAALVSLHAIAIAVLYLSASAALAAGGAGGQPVSTALHGGAGGSDGSGGAGALNDVNLGSRGGDGG